MKCRSYFYAYMLSCFHLCVKCTVRALRWLYKQTLSVFQLWSGTVLHDCTYLCFPFELQTPPEKQQRPKSLQLGDRRLTLSLFQGVSSQLNLSNPLSPLPASPQPLHTPRSSSTSLNKHRAACWHFYFLLKTCLAHRKQRNSTPS